MRKTSLRVSLLTIIAFSCLSDMDNGATSTPALSNPPPVIQGSNPAVPGLFVTKVFPNSPAEAAGIRPMDIIIKYGDYAIVDDTGFFNARNYYEKSDAERVEVTLRRGLTDRSVSVATGWLGVSTTENDETSQEFRPLMNRINAMREIPEYMHDREFKGQFVEGPTKILEKATALIDRAEREGKWTAAQAQVARIYTILDEASLEDQAKQTELLKQFFKSQPTNYILYLGYERFFRDKRFRAAIACFNHYLMTSPNDVSARLNLAVAYNKLGMYVEAESAAKYVFANHLGLSEYGQLVAYEALAISAAGRRDYGNCIQFAEKAFAIEQKLDGLMLIQLAAAQMGDREKFEQAVQKLQETMPARYLEYKLEIDAVDAYSLVKNNQTDAARKLVRMWKDLDRAEGKVIGYWRNFPDGMDVARNWAQLMRD